MTLPIEFGVNETTAFMFAYWGGADLGRNQNFPSGPDTRIVAPTPTSDIFWREYFRYFLHYQGGTPPLKMLRVATGFDFGNEETYQDWKANPTPQYLVFDNMVYWAEKAGVDLVPVIMHSATQAQANAYLTQPARTAHLVEYAWDLMARYESSKAIVMWDLLNEPSPRDSTSYASWVTDLVNVVRSRTTKPITIGHDLEFVFSRPQLTTIHAALDVWQHHVYNTDESSANLDLLGSWASSAGKPWFLGELGWNARYPDAYHPFYTTGWLSRGIGPVCTMSLRDGGRGAYADYPYLGTLPMYPSAPPPPPPPPPPSVDLTAILARLDLLESEARIHTHGPPL